MLLIYVIKSCMSHYHCQQVYLPAIEGYVPNRMLYTICTFLEFCYIAQHDIIMEKTLAKLEDALFCFHKYQAVFQEVGIQEKGFLLLR